MASTPGAPFFGGRRGRRRLYLVVGAIEAAVLLLLAYLLTAPGAAPPTGTVTGITLEIVGQGVVAGGGGGWFGNSTEEYNSTADGFPFAFTEGQSFDFAFALGNDDSNNHTLVGASVSAPFTLLASDPTLPVTVGGADDATLFATIGTPHAGGAFEVRVTLTVR
jgi:hypothetical protein